MVKYTESQNKIIATGHTVVSFAFVLLFVGSIVWCVLKALSFAAPAVVPVVTGFFLALFFKPYYKWWEKKVRIRSFAVILMLVTLLAPLGLLIWLAGAAIVDQIVSFFRQIPESLEQMFGWFDASFPKLKDVLVQFQGACVKIGGYCAGAGRDAAPAVASAVSAGCDKAAEIYANCGTPVLQVSSNALCEGCSAVGSTLTNCVDSVVQASTGMMQNASVSLGGAGAVSDVPTTNSSVSGLNLGGYNISYEQLSELYAKYGDSIKDAGMKLYHAGAAKFGAAGAGGGVTAVANGQESVMAVANCATKVPAFAPEAVASNSGKLMSAFANCRSALMVAGAGAIGFLRAILYIVVTAIFFVFFLTTKNCHGGKITECIPMLKDETRGFIANQIDAFIDILVGFFQRQVAICLVEGCYYGIGFWLVGLPYGFFIGFLLGVLNLIPLFGSVVCLPFALTVAYFGAGGSALRIVLVLLVWAAGLALDGYFITPKIQGDKTGLGYAGVIFSFLFWSMLLGPMMGMLLAIPLSACCVVLWRSFCYHTRSTKVL